MTRNGRGRRTIAASLIIVGLMLSVAWATVCFLESPPHDDELSWLHVTGNHILNERGQRIHLRGAVIGDLSWRTRWAGERTEGDLSELTQRVNQLAELTGGKVNAVRLTITPNPKTTFPEDPHYPWSATLVDPSSNIWDTEIHPEVYDDQVDALVALAKANGIYVIIEFHGGFCSPEVVSEYGGDCLGPNSYPSALATDPTPWINWHLHWMNRFRNDPTVAGVELWNEPWDAAFGYGDVDTGRQRYLNMTLACAQAINRTNPRALIIITSAPFGYIHQDFIDLHPLPYNVLYGWHSYYEGWPDYWKAEYATGDWEAAYNKTRYKLERDNIGNALEAGMPLVATEFGWRTDSDSEPGWKYQMNDYLSILNEWETNWFIWSWWGNPDHMGLSGDTNYSVLSPQGQVWVKYLQD